MLSYTYANFSTRRILTEKDVRCKEGDREQDVTMLNAQLPELVGRKVQLGFHVSRALEHAYGEDVYWLLQTRNDFRV